MAAPRPRTPSERRYSDRRLRSKSYGLNRKTVAKWRKRSFLNDAPMGPKAPRSTVLTPDEEAMAAAFRRHMLLPSLARCEKSAYGVATKKGNPTGVTIMENEETTVANLKKAWSPPALTVVDLDETAGLGGGGPDFGSELS